MAEKTKSVCPYCGSDEIAQDAAMTWDAAAPRWEAGDPYDKSGCCMACAQADFRPDWVPVDGGDPEAWPGSDVMGRSSDGGEG